MMQLRGRQREVLAYRGGRMAISAVPGAGKTTVLSLLAADLVQRAARQGRDQGQVLVVTFSNAAVANFRAKIAGLLQ